MAEPQPIPADSVLVIPSPVPSPIDSVRAMSSPSAADSVPGPPVPSKADSVTATHPPAPTITVWLTNGMELQVARVEPAPQGYVEVIWPDGGKTFIAEYRVRSISDSTEVVTERVLRDHKSVGKAPMVKPVPQSKPREPCLAPRPLPECKICIVNQAGVVKLLSSGSNLDPPSGYYVVVDIGAIKNTSPSFGVGGDLYFAANGGVARFGLKARLRRWVNQRIAIDLAPGILLAGADGWNGETLYPGFIVEADVTFRGWFALTGGFESVRLAKRFQYGFANSYTIETTDVNWYAGAKLGGGPGPGAGAVGLLAILIVAAQISKPVY